jgi:protein SCO1/2
MRPNRRAVLSSLGAAACLPLTAWCAPGSLPGDSVYQLQAALVDQQGRPFELESLRGAPALVSMFYTSCEMVCPMIFETLHMTLKALPAAERSATKVLLISFDPERDTPDVLAKAAAARGCDSQWTLARGDEATVRKVAAVLGIQYRRLSSGEFNHSSTIDLLDKTGRIVARSGTLGSVDAALVQAAHRAHVART